MIKKNILLSSLIFLFLSCSDSDPVIYVPPVAGCMDEEACNYNPDAEEDDGRLARATEKGRG